MSRLFFVLKFFDFDRKLCYTFYLAKKKKVVPSRTDSRVGVFDAYEESPGSTGQGAG
jgi:hypothetical protein